MSDQLSKTASPHIRTGVSTRSIMHDVAIALLPATVFGVYNFGLYALALILVSVAAAVLTEFFYQYFTGRKITAWDGSALVTGLLLALNLTANVPMWVPILGSTLAVLVFKQLFGGLGKNIINPALGARIVLYFITFITGFGRMLDYAIDAYSGATPLTLLKRGGIIDLGRMFVGFTSGSIGEVSVIAILIGAAYLILRKIIRWQIPVIYIAAFTIYISVYSMITTGSVNPQFLLAHLFGGGLMLGAFFMATDYVTSPMTNRGMVFYAVLIGVLTGLLRTFSMTYVEGVSFAIVIGNLAARLFERVTLPIAFGCRRTNKKAG